MSEKTLIFELFQPFAQYRNPFTFYYAQTYPLPPKSTIIGMLQNAVGDWYGNNRGIEKWWNLNISIHGGFESVFWNYQRLIKGEIELKRVNEKPVLFNQKLPLYGGGLTSERSPTNQQELFNGHLYLFIKGEEGFIEEIKSSIETPKKVLSLGRSEDVIFIKNVELIGLTKRKIAEKNLWLTYPTYIKSKTKLNGEEKRFPIKNMKYPVFSIPVKVLFENNGTPIKTKGELTKKTERKPEFETVIYTGNDYVVYLQDKSEIETEIYCIGDGEKQKIFKIPKEYGWL